MKNIWIMELLFVWYLYIRYSNDGLNTGLNFWFFKWHLNTRLFVDQTTLTIKIPHWSGIQISTIFPTFLGLSLIIDLCLAYDVFPPTLWSALLNQVNTSMGVLHILIWPQNWQFSLLSQAVLSWCCLAVLDYNTFAFDLYFILTLVRNVDFSPILIWHKWT